MRREFIALSGSETQHEVERLMRLARLRHLPVLRDGRLVGLVSHRELLEAALADREAFLAGGELARLRAQPVAPLVRAGVVAVDRSCPPERAVELMLHYGIGFLPVVDEGREGTRVVGIVTEADLLRRVYAGESLADGVV